MLVFRMLLQAGMASHQRRWPADAHLGPATVLVEMDLLNFETVENTGRRGFDVAEEMRPSTAFPIVGIVLLHPFTGTQRAEERMLRGIDHHAYVSAPHHEVSRLGTCDRAE